MGGYALSQVPSVGKGGIPEGGGTPLVLTLLTLVVATEAGDTHPTEMLSCFVMISFFLQKNMK